MNAIPEPWGIKYPLKDWYAIKINHSINHKKTDNSNLIPLAKRQWDLKRFLIAFITFFSVREKTDWLN